VSHHGAGAAGAGLADGESVGPCSNPGGPIHSSQFSRPGFNIEAVEQREERLARNEALFRAVNERIEEIAQSFDLFEEKDSLVEFFCECGRAGCFERINLTRAEYEGLRSDPTHFAVVRGHADPEVERVVRPGDRFDIVEKHPEQAPIARDTDPRV
jgi:hypothetical protein